jgi:hypothetical protein
MPPSVAHIPLLFFGGKDGWGGGARGCVAKAFSVDRNLAVWKRAGTVPLTRACLLDTKVTYQVVTNVNGVVDVDGDPMTSLLLPLEHANHLACDHLSAQECDGDQLRSSAPRVLAKAAVTESYSLERHYALAKASTAGKHIHTTGGEILNTDNFLIAQERILQQRQAGKGKKARLAAKQQLCCSALNSVSIIRIGVDGVNSHKTLPSNLA